MARASGFVESVRNFRISTPGNGVNRPFGYWAELYRLSDKPGGLACGGESGSNVSLYAISNRTSASTATQKTAAPANDPDRSEVRAVYVSVVADDGTVLGDLKRGDFRVLENDQKREVVDASPAPPFPIVIALSVDTSGSEHYDHARIGKLNVLYHFLTQTLSTTDKGLISTFSDDFFFETRLTGDSAELRKGFLKVADTPRRGSTAVYDSIVGSIEALSKEQNSCKFVLALSDFEDNVSRTSLEKTIRAAQKAGVPVFPLVEISSTDRAKHERALVAARKVARESGGAVFEAEPPEELGKSLAALRLAIRSAYLVKYRTGADLLDTKKREKPRTLQVVLPGKKTLFVVVEGRPCLNAETGDLDGRSTLPVIRQTRSWGRVRSMQRRS